MSKSNIFRQINLNSFIEVTFEANHPPSASSMNAQLIDEVQKYLEPNLGWDKLQKELEAK